MGKATVIYKGVEKVSPNKKYQWSIVYPGKNAQYAHNDFDRLAMAMVIKGSANNFCRQMRNWEVNTLAFAKKEYDEFKLREKELGRSAFLRNWPGHITVLGMIKHLEDKWFSGTKEKVFEKWVLHFMDADWVTQKEKSDMIAISLRKIDYSLVIHHKKFGDAPIPIKNRSAPYGTQSRYERNQCAVLDMLAEKLPSFKKNKKAKAKANKKTFRSNAKNEIKQGLDDYSHYRLMSAKEGFVADWYGSKAAVQLRALMHDDVYATFYSYDDLEEVMSHLKQSENWEWHLEHVIPNHYLYPGETCKKVYDYVIQDGRLAKTGYVNYNPMYREEEVIDYNADAGDWGDYNDNWYDWYDQPEYRDARM